MEKLNMMCLSTACVSETTADMLNESAFTDNKLSDELVIHMKGIYGWFVYVPDDVSSLDIPDDLKKCLEVASNNNCNWLAFDRDVEFDEKDGLKEHKW